MAHEVIISYSSHDKLQADAICNRLESKGIRCWIAPRDVPAGTEYADSIVKAIEGAKALLLVYSAKAGQSEQVKREVERAVSEGIKILPVRIEDAQMSKAFEYYVGSIHWLDAITPPLEKHIDKLAVDLKSLLSTGDASDAAAAARSAVPPSPVPKPIMRRPAVLAGGGVLAAALAVVAWLLLRPDVVIPAVADLTEESARDALGDKGLSVTVELVESDVVSGGMVIRSEPGAGKEVSAGGQVKLLVSGMVVVPALRARSVEEATRIVDNLSLPVSSGVETTPVRVEVQSRPDEAEEGVVLESDPGAGKRIMMGETVTLYVSAPKIELPDVVGQSEPDALQQFEAAGLEATVVKGLSKDVEVGYVYQTIPAARDRVSAGSEVKVHVAALGGWAYLNDDTLNVDDVIEMPQGMNLRDEPQGDVLGQAPAGTSVTVVENRRTGWTMIIVN